MRVRFLASLITTRVVRSFRYSTMPTLFMIFNLQGSAARAPGLSVSKGRRSGITHRYYFKRCTGPLCVLCWSEVEGNLCSRPCGREFESPIFFTEHLHLILIIMTFDSTWQLPCEVLRNAHFKKCRVHVSCVFSTVESLNRYIATTTPQQQSGDLRYFANQWLVVSHISLSLALFQGKG